MDIKMTYYQGPLDKPSLVHLWAPSLPPVSRKQLLSRLHVPYS
jgi:hypothetical protein